MLERAAACHGFGFRGLEESRGGCRILETQAVRDGYSFQRDSLVGRLEIGQSVFVPKAFVKMIVMLRYPVKTNRRAEFGRAARGRFRAGLDLFVPFGTLVHAAASGDVIFAGPRGRAGNAVIIRHVPGIETGYFHLSQVRVSAGNHARSGDVIAVAGNSGIGGAPRVHFVVSVGRRLVDPDDAVALGVNSYAAGLRPGGHVADGEVNLHTAREQFLTYAVLGGVMVIAAMIEDS